DEPGSAVAVSPTLSRQTPRRVALLFDTVPPRQYDARNQKSDEPLECEPFEEVSPGDNRYVSVHWLIRWISPFKTICSVVALPSTSPISEECFRAAPPGR